MFVDEFRISVIRTFDHFQISASECIFVAMLAARSRSIKRLKQLHPNVDEGHLLAKLVVYCSTEAHSCIEKDAMVAFVKRRILKPDTNGSLRADTLIKAMEEDERSGFVPFFVSTTLGTTNSGAFDDIEGIGIALKKFPDVWLHVDAAYGGSAFICPEMRIFLKVNFTLEIIDFAAI